MCGVEEFCQHFQLHPRWADNSISIASAHVSHIHFVCPLCAKCTDMSHKWSKVSNPASGGGLAPGGASSPTRITRPRAKPYPFLSSSSMALLSFKRVIALTSQQKWVCLAGKVLVSLPPPLLPYIKPSQRPYKAKSEKWPRTIYIYTYTKFPYMCPTNHLSNKRVHTKANCARFPETDPL